MRHLFLCSLLLFSISAGAIADSIALLGVNVVDVRGLRVLQQRDIAIEGNRISAVVEAGTLAHSPGRVDIDMAGKYVIPGLVDAHVHLATDPDREDREEVTLSRLRAQLRGGVTAVRDMGGDVRTLAGLKRRAEINAITSPDIYYSVILGGPGFFTDSRTVSSARGRTPGETDWMRAVTADSDFEAIVLRAQGTGATGLKAYADVPAPLLQAIAESARRHAMPLWSHAYHRGASPQQVASAGVQVISHAPYLAAQSIPDYHSWHRGKREVPGDVMQRSFDEGSYAQLLDSLKASGALLDATLTVFELTREGAGQREEMYGHATMFARMANASGIPLVAGTDTASDIAGIPFPAVHYELQLLVKDAGLAPLQALQAATLHGARAVGAEADFGAVEAGQLANLVVLDENPAEDIEHTLEIAHVLKHGRFVYRGSDPRLPFSSVREGRGNLWLSGQIGNYPGTMTLAGDTIEGQTSQAMDNIGRALEDYGLEHDDLTKCTLMLADIADWGAASEVYKSFFNPPLPARSAFAATGLALGARVEIECVANY